MTVRQDLRHDSESGHDTSRDKIREQAQDSPYKLKYTERLNYQLSFPA